MIKKPSVAAYDNGRAGSLRSKATRIGDKYGFNSLTHEVKI